MPEAGDASQSGAGLRVALVVGRPATPDHEGLFCGVRDYAQRLAQALAGAGVDARVMAPESWGPGDGLAFSRRLRAARPDVVHLQYPSIGHRHSLMPHALGLLCGAPFVVTLHEHSALPRVQRAANALFRATTQQVIFTTAFEARAFGARGGSPVIPIGSNVPVHPEVPARENRVLYFGQLRPDKGIEAFIALARASAGAGMDTRFEVVGTAPPRWREYARTLRAAGPANVSWVENAPLPAVAEAMATSTAAYLPFPDGAGLRRGSLLAALANGLPVIAPFGASTTEALRDVVLRADTVEAAFAQIMALRADPARACRLRAAGRALVLDWTAIAERHVTAYQAVLSGRTDRPALTAARWLTGTHVTERGS